MSIEPNMLDIVKNLLGVTGTYQNDTIQAYINEVKDFILEAGVDESHIKAGVVARGVADLWNLGAGDGKLSEYFIQRVTQLKYKEDDNNVQT